MPQPSDNTISGIFICYRRDDCSGHAGRLFDRLVQHFGPDQIFKDLESLEPGDDFEEVIEKAVGSYAILIAMVGCDWLSLSQEKARKNAKDFVRIEIATALRSKARVIPVLVQGANMPTVDELPEELAKLAGKTAITLSEHNWSGDVAKLISYMEKVLGREGKTANPANPASSAHTLAATAAMPSNVAIPAAPGIKDPKPITALRYAVWVLPSLFVVLVGVYLFSSWVRGPVGNNNTPPSSSPAVSPGNLSIEETVTRARDLSNRKNYADAEPYWRAAVYHDRFNAEYNSGLAVALYFQKKYSEAEPFFRQAVAVNSGDAQTNADLGDVLSAQAKYAEAAAAHREAVRLNPNIHFMDALATDLYFDKKYAEAELWFRKALAVNPNDAELRNSLGNALFDQRKYEEAKTHYEAALSLQRDNPYFQSNVKKVIAAMAEAPEK